MNKTEIKHTAQDGIIQAIENSISIAVEANELAARNGWEITHVRNSKEYINELEKQKTRVKKLFGLLP